MPNVSNFYKLLEFHNKDKESFTCVGYAPTQRRRCRNPVAQDRVAEVKRLLGTLPDILGLDEEELDDTLLEMADLSTCNHHKAQGNNVALKWRRTLQRCDAYTSRASSFSSSSTRSSSSTSQAPDDDFQARDAARLQAEFERLQRQFAKMEELWRQQRSQRSRAGRPSSSGSTKSSNSSSRRPQTPSRDSNRRDGREFPRSGSTNQRSTPQGGNGNEDDDNNDGEDEEREQEQRRQVEEEERARRDSEDQRRRRREEAQRQSRREREEQEADARRRAEQTQRRQRDQEARERLREQEARTRAQIWESSWTRYERDWAHLSRIDTTALDENILDTLPWPVQDGRWQDVTPEANIREFFRHAPQNARPDVDPQGYVNMLKQQARRWHPDRVGRTFPGSINNTSVNSLVTVVAQIIVDEIRRTREQIERAS